MMIPASRLRWPSLRRGDGGLLLAGLLRRAAGFLAAVLLREPLFGLLVALTLRVVVFLPLLFPVAIAQMFLPGTL